jgi:hypothetical protein
MGDCEMRNALLTLILLAILAVDTGANPAGFFAGYVGARRLAVLDAWEAAGLNDGLVSYWAMRTNTATTVIDEYGSNEGVAANSPTFSAANGVRDDGVGFVAASSQYITVTDADSLTPSNTISISAWIKPATIMAPIDSRNIVAKYDTTAGVRGWLLQTYRTTSPIENLQRLRVLVSSDGTTVAGYFTGNIAALSTLEWVHVAATINTANVNPVFYVNGQSVSGSWETGSMPASMFNNSASLLMGARLESGSAGSFFNGSIDEVGIWNRALSSNEVYRLYNTPLYAPYKE